jgi:hypothetical protein
MERAYGNGPYSMQDPEASSSTTVFNPRTSDSEIPLTAQQWDKEGKAVGFIGDPRFEVSQPQPRRHPHGYAPRQSVDIGWDMGAQPHGSSSHQLYDPYAPQPPQLASHEYQTSSLPPRISSPPPRSPITMPSYQSRQNSMQYQQSTQPTQQGRRDSQQWQSNNPYSPRRTSLEISQTPTQAQFVSHSTSYSPQHTSSQNHPVVRAASPRTSNPASPTSGALPMPSFPVSPTVHSSSSPSIQSSLAPASMGSPPPYQSQTDVSSQQRQNVPFSSHLQEATDASNMSYHTAVSHSRNPTTDHGYTGYSSGPTSR